jgi:capsular exopolysaccharide synthesis family protein
MRTELVPMTGNLPAAPLPYGGSDLPPSGGGRSTNPLVRLIAAIRRFWWLILLTTVAGAALGFVATRFMPPKYVVEGTIFIEERGGTSGPVDAGGFLSGSQWIELLKRPTVIEPVVMQQRLYVVGPNPSATGSSREGPSGPDAALFEDFGITEGFLPGEYTLKITPDGRNWELLHTVTSRRATGTVADSVGREFGLLWLPRYRERWSGETFRFTLLTPREVTNDIAGALGTQMAARSARFVTVTYDGTDGERAARTLNSVMRRLVSEAALLKRQTLTEEARAIDTQLEQAYTRLTEAELALQNFGIATATSPRDDAALPPGSQMALPSTFGTYFAQRATIDSLRRDRRELVSVVERTRAGDLTTDQMLAIGAVRTSPDLSRILNDISTAEAEIRSMIDGGRGPEWRDLVNARERVRELRTTTLPAYADAVIRRIDEDLASREGRLQTVEREMRDIPTRTITQQRLARELELARGTHADIQRRAEIARLQEASSLSDLRILNDAVAPLRPSKNRKTVILALALLAGLGTGVGIAFLLDMLDKRFQYADQVTSGLGLSILGVIPEIKRAKGKTPTAEEAAQVVEAFRSVRLNLAHIFPETGPITMTVSSPSPGDGKSLISSNLALSFAEAGYRTMLIDGDTRRGEMHRTFGIERRPGLLDHLVGECTMEQAFRPSTHAKLTLMPHGSRHRNAPELLGSRRMHELLAALKERFEVILIDSPPLGAGIDPFVLSTVTGNLMLVVRAGSTERDLAEAKLEVVDRLPIRLVGAVLNDVRTSMAEYKYYSYSYGYSATDEIEETPQLPALTTKES